MELVTVNQTKSNAVQMASPTCLVDSVGPKERIWLEVGHAYEPRRWASGRAVAQDWHVWVRGVAGADISALAHKVVFQLRPENQFPYPKRVFEEPPYEVKKSGVPPTEIFISVYLKCAEKPERINLKYGPLFINADRSSAEATCIFYDVQNPSEALKLLQMKPSLPAHSSGSVVVVLPDSGEVRTQQPAKPILEKENKFAEPPAPLALVHKQILNLKGSSVRGNFKGKPKSSTARNCRVSPISKTCPPIQKVTKSYEFVAPIKPNLWENMKHTKPGPSKPAETQLRKRSATSKSSECFSFDNSRTTLKNLLRRDLTVKLTEGELDHVSRMCSAQGIHGKSVAALRLPPWSDPLYRLPELPPALRRTTHRDEPDHVLQ